MNATNPSLARELHEKLATIDITTIPVLSRDRSIPRKEQAALARSLFKSLGLRGISVTAPNYSMARSVDIRLPKRNDYVLNTDGTVLDYATDPAAQANVNAEKRLGAILLAAFPRHDDRSDTQSDHFDYRWSLR